MNFLITHLVLICLFITAEPCTFSSSLIGSWKSSNYGTVTIASSSVTLGKHTFNIGGKTGNTVYSCNSTSGSTYVVRSDTSFSALGQTGYAFICMSFTQVNSNAYYFYMNSAENSVFGGERISFWATTTAPSHSQACSETAPAGEFTSLVKSGSESDAKTNCMSAMFGDFTYSCTSSTGQLTVCTDRQTLVFNTSLCSKPYMFSDNGNLGCISSITDGSTYYAGLYNYDSSVNELTTFQFVCIKVTTSGSEVSLVAEAKRCEGGTNTVSYTLTAYNTCPITEDPGVNVLAIVLGVIFGLIFLILLALLIYYCCKKKKKRDKRKALLDRNLKIFEKKMAMDEFDDDHPLNEASLVPDYPQNGYPMPLPLKSPKAKKYSMPKVLDAGIQTERSYSTTSRMDPTNGPPTDRSYGGLAQKSFHGSNKSLSTTRESEEPMITAEQPQSVMTTSNKTLQNKLLNSFHAKPDFPTEPQYLPWPWRTANRAMKSSSASMKSSFRSRKAIDLGEYTIKNYGIKYDDTLTNVSSHPPPRRPLSRASSVMDISRPTTGMLKIKKSFSTEHLNRAKTSMAGYSTNTGKTNRSVSHKDVYKPFKRSLSHEPPLPKLRAPSRRASVASIKNILQRSNSRVLKTINETPGGLPAEFRAKRKPPLPTYMRPLTRSKTVPVSLKKASNVYGNRPTTGKARQQARSMLQTKLKHYSMEKQKPTVRRKKYTKKKSSWKSPFSLPSSLQSQPISLKSFGKSKNAKVEPWTSSRSQSKFNDSLTSRDYVTTDQDMTSDSNGENFMDAEISKLPHVDPKKRSLVEVSGPRREATYKKIEKKVSEDSGISTDESPTAEKPPPTDSGISADDDASSNDDTRFPLPDIIETLQEKHPGQLKPPPRRKPWH